MLTLILTIICVKIYLLGAPTRIAVDRFIFLTNNIKGSASLRLFNVSGRFGVYCKLRRPLEALIRTTINHQKNLSIKNE